MTIKFTRFRKFNGSLTKILSLTPAGELHKDSAGCAMSSGEFETLNISHVHDLVGVLTTIKKTECLGYGVCRVRAAGKIVAQDKAGSLDITRTKENFLYAPGCPALLMLDYDRPSCAPTLSREEWLACLSSACPALEHTARVWRASTTSYIYDSAGNELRSLTGQRLYVAVVDGADIPRAGDVLFKRLWLKGHGRIEISKAGAQLTRAPVDACVFSPERLDFVAGAVCKDGLRQGGLTPLYMEGITLLDTRAALPDLTPEEEIPYQHLVETAKALMKGEAEKARESYIDERSEEIAAKRSITKEEAYRTVVAAIAEKADLYPDFSLKFDRYGEVPVADVLADLKRYDGATLADPLEPDYGGGRTVARLFDNISKDKSASESSSPVIHSFAHGGKRYLLSTGFNRGAAESAETAVGEARALLDALDPKDPGAWFDEKVLEALATLKAKSYSDYKRSIDAARKAKVSLKELKKRITNRARVFFENVEPVENPTLPTLYAGSRGYPAFNPSLGRIYLHNPLLAKDLRWEGLPKQSNAANWLQKHLIAQFAWDAVSEEWTRYDGKIWVAAHKKQFIKFLRDIIDAALAGADGKGYSYNYLTGVENFLQADLHAGGWATGGELLPLENGVLRLHTKELIPYSPEMWFNWRLPYRYEPGADCPTIKWWLKYVTHGDQELAALLRAWMRAVLTGRHDLQRFLELIGPGGTGKSTFMLLCTLLVGETNQVSTNLQNLENNRFEGALLYGKRLVLITDSERYGGAISTLKSITGGDPIRYERKNRQQQAPFIFTGLVMIAANEQVQNTDYTSGLVRRRISVKFSQRVTQKEREDWYKKGGLLNAMKKELPGLLNELLALGDDEVTRIIGSPGAATWTANRQAMIHQNPMAAWLEDQIVADPDATPYVGAKRQNKDSISGLITLKDVETKLYPNYLQWVCENGQHHPIALRRFTELLLDICCTLGIEVEKLPRASAGTPIKGIRLRTDQDKDIPTPVLGIVMVDDGVGKCRVSVDKNTHETRISAQSVGNVGKNRSQGFKKDASSPTFSKNGEKDSSPENPMPSSEDDDSEVLA